MPAIDLKRFSKETAELAEQFDQPAVFIVSLRTIFDLYSNRTIKRHLSRAKTSGLPNLNVPTQVISQIVIGLNNAASRSAEKTLEIIDALWAEGTFETRSISARLFHKLPVSHPAKQERLTAFLSENAEPTITNTLLRSGIRDIRVEQPIAYLEMIKMWLNSSDTRLRSCAVKSLIFHINDDSDINLPQVINLLVPEIRERTLEHQFDIVDMIIALSSQSPSETSYFLKEVLRSPVPRSTQIIFRKFSPELPDQYSILILSLLRAPRD